MSLIFSLVWNAVSPRATCYLSSLVSSSLRRSCSWFLDVFCFFFLLDLWSCSHGHFPSLPFLLFVFFMYASCQWGSYVFHVLLSFSLSLFIFSYIKFLLQVSCRPIQFFWSSDSCYVLWVDICPGVYRPLEESLGNRWNRCYVLSVKVDLFSTPVVILSYTDGLSSLFSRQHCCQSMLP